MSDAFGTNDCFAPTGQDLAANSGLEQASVIHHEAAGIIAAAADDGFGPSDGFGSDSAFCSGDAFALANAELSFGGANPDPAFAFADALAAYRGISLKVKRSSGAVEGGWQIAAGAHIDAHGMVELAMGELSRGMLFEELVQLNTDVVPRQVAAVPSGRDAAAAGFGTNDCFAPSGQDLAAKNGSEKNLNSAFDDAIVSSCPQAPSFSEPSSDVLAPFRRKNLNVKRSSGAVEGGWQLATHAFLDSNGNLEVVKGDLLRSISFKELKDLNYEIVRVALGELTPEEILAGLSLGQNVFQASM